MIEKFKSKRFFFVTLGVVGYFCLLLLVSNIKIDNVFITQIIRFVGEITLLPLMFLVIPALLILSIIYCIKDKFRIKNYSFWSFLILLISNVFWIASFIIHTILRIGRDVS